MKKKETEEQKKLADEWRKGYDMGVKNIMIQNDIEIKIGRAILDALDRRYEFQKEEY